MYVLCLIGFKYPKNAKCYPTMTRMLPVRQVAAAHVHGDFHRRAAGGEVEGPRALEFRRLPESWVLVKGLKLRNYVALIRKPYYLLWIPIMVPQVRAPLRRAQSRS